MVRHGVWFPLLPCSSPTRPAAASASEAPAPWLPPLLLPRSPATDRRSQREPRLPSIHACRYGSRPHPSRNLRKISPNSNRNHWKRECRFTCVSVEWFRCGEWLIKDYGGLVVSEGWLKVQVGGMPSRIGSGSHRPSSPRIHTSVHK